jgi:hypothetical protein
MSRDLVKVVKKDQTAEVQDARVQLAQKDFGIVKKQQEQKQQTMENVLVNNSHQRK